MLFTELMVENESDQEKKRVNGGEKHKGTSE